MLVKTLTYLEQKGQDLIPSRYSEADNTVTILIIINMASIFGVLIVYYFQNVFNYGLQ